MAACMEIGLVRVYSKLPAEEKLNYESWKASIRNGNTFATFGPLLEFAANGREAGSCISLTKGGGRLTVTWCVEIIKFSLSSIELIVNGEILDGKNLAESKGEGYFDFVVKGCAWVCLLVRGIVDDGFERILHIHRLS